MAQSHELTHPKYRPDIDGLRAISVLSVIGFHAFPGWLRDGFVGVDIFFVISGFLISTIIFENLERGSFSFREFYRRRIKRIFPALAVVLATCLIFGWFELLADEYEALGRHVAAGVGFVSNYLLWSENGYFDAAAETKPLLHLWSLGIEEQFYIVWPFLLWLAWRQKISLVVVIGAIAALSFGLNVWRVHGDTAASFYSPQTRFWELLVGAALAYLAVFKADTLRTFVSPRNSQFLSLGGVALLAICFVLVSSDREFPGWWALLPTMSAALLLAAGMQGWVNRRILSNPVLVWFGLISFPLYLWHWPLLSFLRIVVNKPDPAQRLAAIAISIILAWLTYRAVERPIRFGAHKFEPAYALAGALLLIGSAGYTSVLQNGFPGYGVRTTEIAEFAQYFENSLPGWHYYEITGMNDKYREDCDFYDISRFRIGRATTVPIGAIDRSCYQRTPHGQKTLFIWGDSHAKQLYYGLNNNLPNSWDVLIVASAGCKPSLSAKEDSATDYCQRSNWFALKSIRETHPDVAIVAQVDKHRFADLMTIGNRLKAEGVGKVVFTGPTPHWNQDLPRIVLRRLWNNTPERTFVGLDEDNIAADKNLKAQFSSQEDFVFVDLVDFFCNAQGCLTRIGDDRRSGITSWDYGHLTPIASDYLAKNLLAGIVTGNP